MEFVFTPEQEQLRTSMRRFLEAKSPESEVRRLMDSDDGYDRQVWQQLTGELGVTGLAVPEQYGGFGFTFLEVAIVLEEMGRALLCAPFLSSCLATAALLHADDEQARADLLPGIAAGTTLATVAYMEAAHDWAGAATRTTASRGAAGTVLDGTKSYVIDGAVADLLIVLAGSDGGLSLFAVDAHADGVSRTPLDTMDRTRRLADVTFTAAPARPIGPPGAGAALLARTLDVAASALAAEQVGGAQRAMEMSVEYAKLRVQFGRPIGSFQAIKHKCADMFLAVESARSAAQHAAWAVAEDPAGLPVAASIAKSHCSEAYATVAAENIQVHGGIGFTWEHPAHLYFKRAKSSELLFGDAVYHRDLIARRIGLVPA